MPKPKLSPCEARSRRTSSIVASCHGRARPTRRLGALRCAADRRSPPSALGRGAPCSRSRARQRLTLAALTPNRAAASRCVAPACTAARTRVRRSRDSAFDMPAGLPAGRQSESKPDRFGNPPLILQFGFRTRGDKRAGQHAQQHAWRAEQSGTRLCSAGTDGDRCLKSFLAPR